MYNRMAKQWNTGLGKPPKDTEESGLGFANTQLILTTPPLVALYLISSLSRLFNLISVVYIPLIHDDCLISRLVSYMYYMKSYSILSSIITIYIINFYSVIQKRLKKISIILQIYTCIKNFILFGFFRGFSILVIILLSKLKLLNLI